MSQSKASSSASPTTALSSPPGPTAADLVAATIAQAGTEHVFTVAGGGMLYLLDAVCRHPRLQYICNHHEQASTMAAEAYGRLRSGLGVALVTFGPGVTNAITGVMGAWMDSVPLLVLSGQSKTTDLMRNSGVRQRGIQEVDVVPLVQSFTKYAAVVERADDLEEHLRVALAAAFGDRPGPVWLDIPMDVQAAPCAGRVPDVSAIRAGRSRRTADVDVLRVVAERLHQAQRPLLYLGHGVRLAQATEAAGRLATTLGIPVVTSWNGADLFDHQHRLYVGRPGIYGQRGANFALQNCDVLLTLGARLSIPQTGYELATFARTASKIVVDVDGAELDKLGSAIDLRVCADVGVFLDALLALVAREEPPEIAEWRERCAAWRQRYPTVLPEYAHETEGLNSYWFCGWLSRMLPPAAKVVTDMGTSFTGTYQALDLKPGQRIVTSSGLASMGYGLAAAIGAACASQSGPTVCLTGDGGIQMNVQELMTIAQYRLPVKIVVLNNNGYLTIRHTQRALLGRVSASSPSTGVSCPDFAKLAAAYGIPYTAYRQSGELPSDPPEWLTDNGPQLCEITMPSEQPLIPKTSFRRLPDGRLVSPPLEDLYPFLSREELEENMVVPRVRQ